MLIFLIGTPAVMHSRTLTRHKSASTEYLEKLQSKFHALCRRACAHAVIDTVDVTLHEVVLRISRLIHLEAYEPANLERLLTSIASEPL